ncbi:hypothetical protein [Pararhizobium sp.]|uniref:hypothetical protein n=1 Tax=Pararhizobium sp. TaxID=1977563 RepID=UPI00271F37E0|nr:hypothetical protein [Pararhizobium sp.]MDO9415056.1 hypothetical protein [Pararhizobium sp.]
MKRRWYWIAGLALLATFWGTQPHLGWSLCGSGFISERQKVALITKTVLSKAENFRKADPSGDLEQAAKALLAALDACVAEKRDLEACGSFRITSGGNRYRLSQSVPEWHDVDIVVSDDAGDDLSVRFNLYWLGCGGSGERGEIRNFTIRKNGKGIR